MSASSSEEKSPDKSQGFLRKNPKTSQAAHRFVRELLTMMRWGRCGCLFVSDVPVHVGNVSNRQG